MESPKKVLDLVTLAGGLQNRAPRVPLLRDELRDRHVVFPGDTCTAAQAYRMLRTQLLQRMRMRGERSLGVISPTRGDGKTLTAVNLAFGIAAEPNQNVLLVDLDLRSPSVARVLGLPDRPGLETFFTEGADVAQLIVRFTEVERLSILPTRASVSSSSEHLAAPETKRLIENLRSRYPDRVIIYDLPPVLLADDGLTVLQQIEGMLLVVSEGVTRRDDVARARQLIGDQRIIGAVLNRASDAEQRLY